jgi:hypothetical protein
MNTNPDESSSTASLTATDHHVLRTIQTQQQRLKWLTGIAAGFWVLAVIASVGVLICYSVFYAPKERQILSDYGTYGHLRMTQNAASEETSSSSADKALGLQFTMTYVVTKGILLVAVSVVILSCGTLATLLLVILNRRVTLQQINHSLAQISQQLRELQNAPSA